MGNHMGIQMEIIDGYVDTLKLELIFLRTFLEYAAPRCIHQYRLIKHLLRRAQDLNLKASVFLKEVEAFRCSGVSERAMGCSNAATLMLDEVKLVNLEITEFYGILSRKLLYPMSNKLLMKFINSLLKNIQVLLVSSKVHLVGSLRIELEALGEKLRFLTTFLMFISGRCSDRQKLTRLFNHAKFVADNAAYRSHSCFLHREMDDNMADRLASDLSELVRKIDPAVSPRTRKIYMGVLRASSESPSRDLNSAMKDTAAAEFVDSLMKNGRELLLAAGWTVPMRDQIQILLEELAFLRYFLMDPRPPRLDHPESLSSVSLRSEIISTKAGSMVYTLLDCKMKEKTPRKVHSSLVNLLEELKLIKAEIREAVYVKLPKPECSKFSSPDELGSLDRFLWNLRELLNNETAPFTYLNVLIEPLLEELQILRSFSMSKIAKQHFEQEKLKVLWTQIVDVASQAEYIVDSLLVGNGSAWCLVLWLSDVRKEIGFLKAEVYKIGGDKNHNNEMQHGEEISSHLSPDTTSPELNEVVIGFEDVEESVTEDLVEGPTKLQMVAIVGMPGQGKTHLAKKIYNNPTVKDYFDVCAWCYVSPIYDRNSLLTRILSQVREPTKKKNEQVCEELAEASYNEQVGEELADEALYKSLKGKRYFILMDDLWDIHAWDAVKRCFPDDKSGSRIMYTSRFHNLDLKAFGNKIHHLRPFFDDESWRLLQEKVFQRQSCPSELLEVGKRIAKNCHGLPLTVVVVAGILARIEKKQLEWSKIANSLNSYIVVDDEEKKCMKVIELSYKHLPDYLKPCFLYMAAFVNDKHIRVQDLIRLWVAEGFIHKVDGKKCLEDIAMDYLVDLVNRSLIIVTERSSIGGIRKWRIHDLICDFLTVKAEEEKVLRFKPGSTSDISYMRRICCNQTFEILSSNSGDQHVRSLLFFYPQIGNYDLPSMCGKFKLLSVLNLGCIWVTSHTFPEGIDSLTLLRYLSICGSFQIIPASIANLWNLQTFIMGGFGDLPHTIWNMINLRHLEISLIRSLSLPHGGVSRLENLQTISTLVLSVNNDTVELMKGLGSVKRLKCCLYSSNFGPQNPGWLLGLAALSQLQSLSLRLHCGKWFDNYELSLPSNLKKLTMLGSFSVPWNKICIIGKLPHLEVLKLCDGAFTGQEWDMTTDGDQFPKLKFLKLENLNIRKWSFSSNCFPPLEQLGLQSCRWLEEIPGCLEDIPTLKVIQVIYCNSRLEKVVKQIHQEQLEFGNQDLKVVIQRWSIMWPFDSSDEDNSIGAKFWWSRGGEEDFEEEKHSGVN